jgi:isopenicillin N synthase-like dioxygenase
VAHVTKPNMSEAFFMARDLAADHPDVVSGRRFRSANQWPEGLPGFREPLVDIATRWSGWCNAWYALMPARSTCPPHTSMGPSPTSSTSCARPTTLLIRRRSTTNGIAPYTDTSFLTLLAPNDVPGLAFRTQTGDWIDVPTVPDAFIVNGGQLLLRWTNDCFLATPHRAVNRTSGERYALAFFCDAQIDWPIAAVPTCVGPLRPPR